jgi:hypothetical protein
VELAVRYFHGVDRLHRGRPGERHKEDALTLILLAIDRSLDMAFPVVLLTCR